MITKFHHDPFKGHNSSKGDNPDLKHNCIFYEESIYEISKLYLNKFCNRRTDGCTDEPKAICPLNFSKVGGIIKHHIQESQEVSPSHAGDHQAAMNRPENKTDTKYKKQYDPQKKDGLGAVSKNTFTGGLKLVSQSQLQLNSDVDKDTFEK